MPTNKNAHLRFKIIDTLLSSGGIYTKNQILQKIKEAGIKVSGPTFDKDLKTMREKLMAPIDYEQRSGYYYTNKGFKIFNRSWKKEESAALNFACEALNTLNVDLALEAQAVLLNITNRIHERDNRGDKKIIYRPPSTPVKGVEWLHVLYDAIDQEKALTIKYYKLKTKETKTHTISPYILRQYNDLWYVIAWCASRELTLVFALDRIREVKPAFVSYYQDPKFDADQYFQYSYGITHSYYDKPQKVIFWVDRDAYYYMEARPMHHSQKVLKETSTQVMVQIEVIISEELVMALRGLGKKIKKVKPGLLSIRINGTDN